MALKIKDVWLYFQFNKRRIRGMKQETSFGSVLVSLFIQVEAYKISNFVN